MIKVRVNKVLALLMIYLTISLIFSTAFVFATIYEFETYGSTDEVPGAIRSDDTLIIHSWSTLNASVKTNETFERMSCGRGEGETRWHCEYSEAFTNITNKVAATIKEDSSGDTQEVEVFLDNLTPQITSFTPISLKNKVKVSYSLVDRGNPHAPTNKCSGIEKVELYLNDQLVNTSNHTVAVCTGINGELVGTVPNYRGRVNVSLVAYDYFDFMVSANRTGSSGVVIDSMLPVISSSAKVYRTGTTDEITKISTNSTKEVMVDIEVYVEEDTLSITAYGNFSSLDKDNPSSQAKVDGVCTSQGWSNHTCVFKNLKLKPSTNNPSALITVTDQVGNIANQTVGFSFTIVNDAGTVTRLGPDQERCLQDQCFLKGGANEIIALISTTTSYNDSDITIAGTQADCEYNNTWMCKAEVSVSDGKISLEGYDDLGNYIQADSEITFVVDSIAPKLVGEVNVTPDCAISTRNENVVITFNVSESKSPEVIVKTDPQKISTDNITESKCVETQTPGLLTCTLTIGNLKPQGLNTNLNVIVEDFAGNTLSLNVPVSICIEVGEQSELIEKIKTRGKLPKIDQKVAGKIAVKVPIGLKIETKYDDVEIMERSAVDCSNTPGIQGTPHLINNEGLKPILVLSLQCTTESCLSQWNKDGKIKVNCTQQFLIKHQNRIYTGQETELITAELEVYDQPLGTLTQSYNKLVKEKKERLVELDEQIEKWEKIDSKLGWVCDMAEKIGRINVVIQSAKSLIYIALLTIQAIPGIGQVTAASIWGYVHGTAGFFDGAVQKFIWPTGWVPTGDNIIGFVVKSTCSIYSCKFYDFNTYISIAMSIAAHKVQQAAERKLDQEKMEEYLKEQEEKIEKWAAGEDALEAELLNAIKEDYGFDGSKLILTDSGEIIAVGQNAETFPVPWGGSPGTLTTWSQMYSLYQLSGTEIVLSPEKVRQAAESMYKADAFLSFVNNDLSFWAQFGSDFKPNTLAMDQASKDFVAASGGTWIVNPYKSVHYDDLCIPAILFNNKKEQQLTCRYLKCLDDTIAQKSGAIEQCDFEYELGTCLYLDSAQYRLQPSVWESISEGVGSALMNSVAGVGMSVFYLFLVPNPKGPPGCWNYQKLGGEALDWDFFTGGAHSAICGTVGTALSITEMESFFDNKFRFDDRSPTDLPGEDFCQGLSYQ